MKFGAARFPLSELLIGSLPMIVESRSTAEARSVRRGFEAGKRGRKAGSSQSRRVRDSDSLDS